MDDKSAAFKEFMRIIKKPNGVICIVEPTPKVIEGMRKRFPSHPDAVDPRVYAKTYNLSVEVKNSPLFDVFVFKKNK